MIRIVINNTPIPTIIRKPPKRTSKDSITKLNCNYLYAVLYLKSEAFFNINKHKKVDSDV